VASDALSLNDIVRLLPQSLRPRFQSVGSYTHDVINEVLDEQRGKIRLSNSQIDFISCCVFIFLLDRFLNEGTAAARGAAKNFSDFGIKGFKIGQTTFTEDNENTRRGEMLAGSLKSVIGDPMVIKTIETSDTVRNLVERLISQMRHD
jgi:hypothetical protein